MSDLASMFLPQQRQLQPTGKTHPITGRPVYIDPQGYPETEKSVTLQDPRINGGAWTNLPTIWGGRQMTDEQWAANNAVLSGQQFPAYNSLDEALKAAVERSRVLGNFIPPVRR